MKSNQKIAILVIALAVSFAGFFVDSKNNICSFAQKTQEVSGSVVNVKEPLTVHNETGSKVNAAFYNKRLKRRGSIIRIQGEKTKLSRTPLVPYLAVSRNTNELGEKITKNKRSSRVNIRRMPCVTIKAQGQELIVTGTSVKHKH